MTANAPMTIFSSSPKKGKKSNNTNYTKFKKQKGETLMSDASIA